MRVLKRDRVWRDTSIDARFRIFGSSTKHKSFRRMNGPMFDTFQRAWDEFAVKVLPRKSWFSMSETLGILTVRLPELPEETSPQPRQQINAEGVPLFADLPLMEITPKQVILAISAYLTDLWGEFVV